MRRGDLLVPALVLAGSLMGGAARAADKPKVGYLGSDLRGAPEGTMNALDSGAVTGLESMTTIARVEIPRAAVTRQRSGRLCASEACAQSIAARSGAEYLVRADVRRAGQADYTITLDLIRVAPFAVVFTGEDRCPACVPAKLARRMELAVAALVAKLVESLEARPVITERSAPSAGTPARASAAATLEVPTTSAPPERIREAWWQQRWVPWAAAGTATAALVGGVVAWRAADDGTCSLAPMERQCPRLYNTKPLAIGLGAAGAVVASGAAWTFYEQRQRNGRDLTLAPFGTGLVLGGRF